AIAAQIIEYGFSYCQYSYSMPSVITEFFHLFMMVNHPEYFLSLGFKDIFYDPKTNEFKKQAITDNIKEILIRWKEKHPLLDFKTQNLKFDNLVGFNYSFTTEMELLNTESK
ncbi:MAG: hypothetical protein ACRDEB_00360, partial [Chitinophagaceae bacterium]